MAVPLLLSLALLVSCAPTDESKQDLGQGWRFSTAAQGKTETLFEAVTLPITIGFNGDGWITASARFTLDKPVLALSETWVTVSKVDFPFEARVNGVLLYRHGVLPPGQPFVQSSSPALFFVPTTLWKPQENELELRIWKKGGSLRFPEPVRIVGPQEADFQRGVVVFLNTTLFLMFFGINLLGGVYFLMLWAGRPKELDQLWFALSTLLIGAYFLSLGSPISLLPGVLHFALLKACLGPSIAFLLLFLITHFRLLDLRWLKIAIVVVYLPFSVLVALSTSMTELAERFTFSMLPLELGILFAMGLMVAALIQRRPQAPIIAAGIVIGVAFGSHDVYYQIVGLIPVAWLQGVGFFALEASMFLSLALHSNRMYKNLEASTRELQAHQEKLALTNAAFARFVPRELLSFLGKDSVMDVNLGDQVQKTMTILFSDIRNFTKMTEDLTPRESFNLLNSYLAIMGPVIRDHDGIVDKYIGDAIMALFPQSPLAAVHAAIDMRRSLEEYNKGRIRAGYHPLDMGVGIHTGPLMLGTIGEHQRMDGTVISDAVNTASRIEGLTKVMRVPIIISQATLSSDPHLAEKVPHRYLGILKVRGKTNGLALYEVLDSEDPATAAKVAHKDLFEAAVRSIEGKDEASGAGLFRAYRRLVPGDKSLDFFDARALL
ncbi:MAG: adenylate/guanylate cyclase domain-containing protein [Spirochaetales bacterium]